MSDFKVVFVCIRWVYSSCVIHTSYCLEFFRPYNPVKTYRNKMLRSPRSVPLVKAKVVAPQMPWRQGGRSRGFGSVGARLWSNNARRKCASRRGHQNSGGAQVDADFEPRATFDGLQAEASTKSITCAFKSARSVRRTSCQRWSSAAEIVAAFAWKATVSWAWRRCFSTLCTQSWCSDIGGGEAASVLPLGISRAEVQSVFAHVRGCGTGTLPLSQLTAAAEAARNAGVPLEAAGQIDAKRLAPALQRLGTKASQQEFRVALMQAEPYMTHNQMEWLSELTDKDCEGRLLPPSLLPRLGIPGAVRTEPLSWNTVPPRPIAAKGAHSVAHSLPQVLVIACLMYRIRQRLFVGSQLTLGSLLGLFDIADGSNRQQAESAVINRDLLGSLLGHLKLSISVSEADELLAAIAATAGKRSGDSGCVQVSMLYDMVDRAGQPEMETMVLELREAVRQRLWSKASCFTSVAGSAELLLETDFRRALKAAMAESWAIPGSLPEDDEDRVVLLAEKDAEGRVLWRNFVQAFCGGIELDQMSEITEEPPASPSKPMGRTPGALNVGTASVNGVNPGISQQSWRSQKAAQKMEGSSTVSNKGHADPPLSPQSGQRGFCCFRRRR